MTRACQVSGRGTQVGGSIVRRGIAKKKGGIGLRTTGHATRKFKVNVQTKKLWVPELNTFVTVRISARSLKDTARKGVLKVLADAGIVKQPKPKKKKSKASA